MENNEWKKCSTCKKSIGFNTDYYVCSVSTCNGQRTGYVFCTVSCWDAHVPGARHRDAAAVGERSPAKMGFSNAGPSGAGVSSTPGGANPQRRIVSNNISSAASSHVQPIARPGSPPIPREVLIVASKLKDYIRLRSEMNTSGNVMDILSDLVRRLCDDAIDSARADGRKTVLDRDFKK